LALRSLDALRLCAGGGFDGHILHEEFFRLDLLEIFPMDYGFPAGHRRFPVAAGPIRGPNRARTVHPALAGRSDIAAARSLLQQGKYDEAVSRLSDLGAKKPGLKGLSSELGTAYYKKAIIPRPFESFKKTLPRT